MDQQDTQAAKRLLAKYADAVNAADRKTIASLYSEDGLFMPEGVTSLTKKDLIKNRKGSFKNIRFLISYAIHDVVISNQYAFVIAIATTSATDRANNKETTQTSRDFFVLRKERDEWKVFRYIFNHVRGK